MTTRLGKVLRTETTLFVGGGVGYLNVESMRISADLDRAAFIIGEFVCTGVTEATWAELDPRKSVQVVFASTQYDEDDAIVGTLPGEFLGPIAGWLWIRQIERNDLAGTVTITAASGETMLQDKRRISGSAIDTGAATVSALIHWSLFDVFGGIAITEDSATSAPIPAGERRLMMQGESHMDLLQPELDAIGCRLVDAYGTWNAFQRETRAAEPLTLATFWDAPSEADPCITSLVETIDREGEWADGVLVEYSPPGTATNVFQASGTGANRRGIVVRRDRTPPASNAANQIVQRARRRGHTVTVTARARYDGIALASHDEVRPQELVVHTPSRVLTALIRSVEWDTATGEMTIRANTDEEDPL